MDSKKERGYLNDMVRYIKNLTGEKALDDVDVLHLTIKLMEFVKEYPGLTGKEKKKLVETSIFAYIEQLDVEENNKFLLSLVFKNIIPNAIDLLVDVANGKHKFKHVKKLFSCC